MYKLTNVYKLKALDCFESCEDCEKKFLLQKNYASAGEGFFNEMEGKTVSLLTRSYFALLIKKLPTI